MEVKQLLREMVKQDASDLFCRAGSTPRLRVDGHIIALGQAVLTADEVVKGVEEITTPKQREQLKERLDIDFAFYSEELDRRLRVSIFRQRNWPAFVIRNVRNVIANFEELNLPAEVLKKLCMEARGLILLTGSTGSGKSTSIASMIEYINANTKKHILTVEEPIEFAYKDKSCIINQRELGMDVISYATALRAFTLQSPDVIYIANIRDMETMAAALTAAETGVLVLSTLHTINAAQSVERITNFFPPHQHHQVHMQLATLLKGVISLRLAPLKNQPGRIPACEVMVLTPTISRLIREGNIYEIPKYIEEGAVFGMQSFNQSLAKLVEQGKVCEEEAMNFADNRDEFALTLRGIRKP